MNIAIGVKRDPTTGMEVVEMNTQAPGFDMQIRLPACDLLSVIKHHAPEAWQNAQFELIIPEQVNGN